MKFLCDTKIFIGKSDVEIIFFLHNYLSHISTKVVTIFVQQKIIMEVIVKTQKVFPVSSTSKNKPSLFFEIDAFHPVLAVCGVW